MLRTFGRIKSYVKRVSTAKRFLIAGHVCAACFDLGGFHGLGTVVLVVAVVAEALASPETTVRQQ